MSKPLMGLLIGLLCLWVMFSMSMNWAGAGKQIYLWLAGDSDAVFGGQVWRLFTAPLVHGSSPTHVIFGVMLLYFFAPSLEELWGTKRLFLFLFGSAAFGFALESIAYKLGLGQRLWLGSMGMADAAMVAWALANRDREIRLFFVLPVKAITMVFLMIGWHVALIIARQPSPEGLIAPFGAIAAGYLFGVDTPLKRLYLKFKLRKLQAEVAAMQRDKTKKRAASGFKVIDGGKSDGKADDKKTLN